MPIRLPEEGFESQLREVRVPVSRLVRLSRFPATEPYWSKGVYRFDCPDPTSPSAFGTCYAGDSLEVAFAQSVIHESSRFCRGRYEVPRAEVIARHKISFDLPARKTLLLADLTGEGLKGLGLNNDISASGDYTVTQLWAQAIHDADPKWDGIRYVSRQKNDAMAYAVFERSGLVKASSKAMTDADIERLCTRFNVDII